jgi:hypothetical protein
VSGNHPSPVETAIISAQSGLELLGWMQLVESGAVLESDWRDMRQYTAGRKIAELLGLAGIDPEIPVSMESLNTLDPNWQSGPEVIAGVRNRLVHPRRTGGGVGWTPQVLADVWLLTSAYLELTLLHAFGVNGEIRNRVLSSSPWVGSTIRPPWAPAEADS